MAADPHATLPRSAEELTLRSCRSDLEQAVNTLVERIEQSGYDNTSAFAIRLALEEALTNAVKHGNEEDPAKQVRVRFHVDDAAAVFEIEDEGRGFDPGAVPDPTDDENIEIPAGRGLLLMRAYMTDVHFNERGNRVVMRFEKPKVSNGERGTATH